MGRAPGRRPSCALGLSDRRGCCSSFASLVVDAGGPSASSRASSMSSLCDVRPAAWRRAVVFHDERPSGSECQLGVGFALVVGSLIDAALIEACPSLPCRASFGVRHERRRVMLIFPPSSEAVWLRSRCLGRPSAWASSYGRCRVGAPSAPRRWRAVTWLRQVDARQGMTWPSCLVCKNDSQRPGGL